MECNKEEAFRAKQLAEIRMQKNDFSGALRLAQRAQRLFPELENISQLLTVCEVHCSAEKRLGSEQDWYGILQIEKFADEIIIKKQYRKLALLLHPDKNKLVGSEAAFKLIGEAYRVLGDKGKKSLYDLRLRSSVNMGHRQKLPPRQSKENSSVVKHNGTSKNSENTSNSHFSDINGVRREGEETFWTMCPSCQVKYQYYKTYLEKPLRCQSCRQPFIAYECPLGTGAAERFQRGPVAAKDASNGGSTKVTSQKGTGNPSDPLPKDRFQEFLSKFKGTADNGGSSETQRGVSRNVTEGTGKDDGGKIPKANAMKVEDTGDVRADTRKRGRNHCPDDFGKTSEKVSGKVNFENGGNPGQSNVVPNLHSTRRSMRQKQQVSYNEDGNYGDGDYLVTPKKSKSSDAGEDENSTQKKVDSSVAAGDKNDEKSTEPNSGSPSDVNEVGCLECPDAEFNDFEKHKQEGCFAVNQVWAIYDTAEGMPRYYARVKKVFSPGFKLKITWFEADPDEKDQDEVNWCDRDLPVACGRYSYGDTLETEDRLMFSHRIICLKGTKRGTFMVYPGKGETWALFMNWDIKWSSEPEKHVPFKYEFVEVLSDFVEGRGITVAYLVKVKGFVSLFQRVDDNSFQISRHELYRFSHRIPSFRMTGRERKGVPEGSFELDPAALPLEITAPSAENLMESNHSYAGGSSASATEDGAQPPVGSEKISSPKKTRKSNLEREQSLLRRSPRGSSKLPQTTDSAPNEVQSSNMEEAQKDIDSSASGSKLNTPVKQRKGPRQDISTLRRSPRVLQQNK
ncbi:uncharacterized protein LOC116214052 [Punica granatum]|uniref:Uncharacterized protein LOC116214052 n=1 Tax=Punica granatum TaxID=22663 RepID=A0A218VR09_PUNGR|nr:uncharacterized protein LOC116214052 [Punica granatum]XP_031405152.1 uncharacterized protein LOC116214052 [Punica granatum]OWM62974.1 hypothetical protein CDL15_Pgr020268 [Punica granatum]